MTWKRVFRKIMSGFFKKIKNVVIWLLTHLHCDMVQKSGGWWYFLDFWNSITLTRALIAISGTINEL